MSNKLKVSSIFLFAFLLLLACEKEPNAPALEKGTLLISLTDAPADFDSVNVIFSEISAHIDNEWINIPLQQDTVDLLQWSNGKSIVIGEEEVPVGHYSQIRLMIDDAYVKVNDLKYQMTVPSGAKTGLKFGPEFDILPGSTYELVVDFDANRSVVILGPKDNPTYILQPTIRVVSEAIAGSISGTLDQSYDASVDVYDVYAIIPAPDSNSEPDTVTSAIVDGTTNSFILSFLPAGEYTVGIDSKNHLGLFLNVPVTVGENYIINDQNPISLTSK